MSNAPIATVPIIHQGLRQEETIVQITATLDYLEKVSSSIFSHIKTSVDKKMTHLTKLNERSKAVEAKLDKLSGTNKATKVFASAKYPGSVIPQDYVCDLFLKPLDEINCKQVKIKSKHPLYDPESLKDKCQHFHIRTSRSQIRKNIEVTPEEGLGRLPGDLDSVSSLLLFNTSENLYKKYVMLDPLGVVTKTRQILEDEGKDKDIGAAPKSMGQDMFGFKDTEDYFYSPTLEEIPQLDVPLDLPDLPGIAGDLQFSMDSGPPIAPSGFTPIPDLPTVSSDGPTETVLSIPPPPPVVTSPLPQPDIPCVIPPLTSPPPPPPPPPPLEEISPLPQLPKTDTPAPSITSQLLPSVPSASDDAHANLMEAIRNAGGKGKAKLRSVVDRKQDAKRQKQEEDIMQKSSGGNLMADLHAKLALRRRGISGTQNTADPLEKLLNSIAPPPIKESSDTDDNDDVDDWDD